MTSIGFLQILVFFLVIVALTKPMGLFLTRVFEGQRTFLHPALRWLEALLYKASGVREDQEQRWTAYSFSLIAFSVVSFLLCYALQRLQGHLPLNPQNFGTPVMTPATTMAAASQAISLKPTPKIIGSLRAAALSGDVRQFPAAVEIGVAH